MKKEATQAARNAKNLSAMEIVVSDLLQLYEAVNNPNNAGKTVRLSPNTGPYNLRQHRGTGFWSNGGRLELQKDMSLVGHDDPSLCVLGVLPIDPPIFLEGTNPRYGMIRVGRGNSTIAGLTINAPRDAGSGISTDLADLQSQETTIRIANVISGDPDKQHGTRGVDIRNTGSAVIGRRLKVQIENCEFYGARQGIRIANFQGADGCEIEVRMSNTKCYDNFTGCLITNHMSNSALIDVTSYQNRFTGNGVGCAVVGATVSPDAQPNQKFSGNRIALTGRLRSDDNNGAGDPILGMVGGIVVRGANTPKPNMADDNYVRMHLIDCRVHQNQAPNFKAHGAYSKDSAGVAGKHNHVRIFLQGEHHFTVDSTNSQPAEPAPESNRVVVTIW